MSRLYLILLLIFTLGVRLWRLGQPPAYVFDEVYHVVTIRAYANNDPAGYEWWHQPPEPNTAYEWLHPPLAKLIQAASVKLLGDKPFAWRLPSALFGVISVGAVYYLGLVLFKNSSLALTAGLLFSLDNLQLTMSRIAMNDIFVTTWIILAVAFFWQKRFYLTGLFWGLALATKHSAVLILPLFLIWFIFKRPKSWFKALYCLTLVPAAVYLISFTQFFLQGHSLIDWYHLHQQIWWYQTGLKATHAYQSAALSWPFLIRPVWFYVTYLPKKIGNIYNLGNPAVFWGGLAAFGYSLSRIWLKKKERALNNLYLIAAYLSLFLPLALSPRILFLHHYLPALPFLCLILARVLHRLPRLKTTFLILTALMFVFFYPLNTAIPIPAPWLKYWFWLPTWR